MIKKPHNKEVDKLIDELIKNKLLRHTIQLFSKTDKGLRPFGSGVLARIHGRHFLLTASHVIGHLETGEDLYLRVDKKSYIVLLGNIKSTDIGKSQGVDLAYVELGKQMIPPLVEPYEFLTIDKISNHNQKLDGVNYCVLGFPEKNIKFEDGSMGTGASVYLTSATNNKPYESYKLSEEDYMILNMNGKAMDFASGKPTKVNAHFYGISGCGLWFLSYYLDPNTGEYSIDYRLIGIMTEFRKGKHFCLIGNKIHLIIKALQVIEGMKFIEKPRS